MLRLRVDLKLRLRVEFLLLLGPRLDDFRRNEDSVDELCDLEVDRLVTLSREPERDLELYCLAIELKDDFSSDRLTTCT